MIVTGWIVNIYARSNADVGIKENGSCKNIKFNHIAYTTHPNKEGYYDCHNIYTIDPLSKLNILHNSDFMMNDFLTDSAVLPELSNPSIVRESNLSICQGYNWKMSVYSRQEKIEFINTDIVSIEQNNYFFAAGTLHGHSKVEHFIYERNHGMKLGWDELFKDKRIEKYILDRVKKELASSGYMGLKNNNIKKFIQSSFNIDSHNVLMNFKKSGYFAIVKEGLKVQYNEYEITSYVDGAPSLIVPKKVLKDYMSEKIYNMCFVDKYTVEIVDRCE